MDGCFDCLVKSQPRPQSQKEVIEVKPNPCATQFYKGVSTDNGIQDANEYFANDACAIALQNLNTREIAYCYSNPVTSAEACAQHYEEMGFVRFREIPYKTANYDFLKVDTYPTRRWRDSEITSRW